MCQHDIGADPEGPDLSPWLSALHSFCLTTNLADRPIIANMTIESQPAMVSLKDAHCTFRPGWVKWDSAEKGSFHKGTTSVDVSKYTSDQLGQVVTICGTLLETLSLEGGTVSVDGENYVQGYYLRFGRDLVVERSTSSVSDL